MAEKKKSKTTVPVSKLPVPSFTVSADSEFGIQSMIAIKLTAARLGLPHEEQKAIAVKLREFDLYEEMTRE